jgi:hypothetical protein
MNDQATFCDFQVDEMEEDVKEFLERNAGQVLDKSGKNIAKILRVYIVDCARYLHKHNSTRFKEIMQIMD